MIRHRLIKAGRKWLWFADSDRGLAALLVFLTLYIFIVYPLLGGEVIRGGAVGIFFSLILMAGIAATATHHAVRISIVVLAIIALASHWTNVILSGRVDHLISTAAAVAFFAVQVWYLSKRVFGDGEVNVYRIMGAVAVYLVLGVLWANAYLFLYLAAPDTFLFSAGAQAAEPPVSEMVYFSFVTLTTIGYGDIVAVHPFARSLVTLEGLVGQLYPAILLARLVTQYQRHPEKHGEKAESTAEPKRFMRE